MALVNRGGRWYEIDTRGRAIPASAPNTPANPATTDVVSRIGRRAIAPYADPKQTIFDWRSDDDKARAMRLTVGRPVLSSTFGFGPTDVPEYPPELYTDLAASKGLYVRPNVCVLVEFGVDGYTDSFIMDAVPAQSVVVIASFVRVITLNVNGVLNQNDINFQAAMVPDNGSPAVPAKMTFRLTRNLDGVNPFGVGTTRLAVPRFAKKLRVTRGNDALTPNADLLIAGVGGTDTIPDPGANKVYTVAYDILSATLDFKFGLTSGAVVFAQFDIQP